MAGPTKAQFSSTRKDAGSVGWGEVITKSDTTTFAQPTRGLYIGGTAPVDVAVVFAGTIGAVTLPDLLPGMVHPLSVVKVMSTNTAATEIVGLW